MLSVKVFLKECCFGRMCSEEATAPHVSLSMGVPQGSRACTWTSSYAGVSPLVSFPSITVAKATVAEEAVSVCIPWVCCMENLRTTFLEQDKLVPPSWCQPLLFPWFFVAYLTWLP